MFVSAPRPVAAGAGWPHLRRVVARDFAGPAVLAGDPGHRAHLRQYLSDLAAPYGIALREGLFAGAHGQSYGEMAEVLLRDVLPAGESVDLLVLAFTVPDIRPGRATATYLSHICPGAPFAFAICDQGAAAGFTGLRLIRAYAGGARCPRAVLLVVEQAALHYEPAAAAPVPTGHAGVALLLGPRGTVGLHGVRQRAGLTPATARALIEAELAKPGTLLAGPGLAAFYPAAADRAGVRLGPAGRPYTGLWAALADELSGPATGPRLIRLAEYDPTLGYLCLSTMDVRGTTELGGDARDATTTSPVELGAA